MSMAEFPQKEASSMDGMIEDHIKDIYSENEWMLTAIFIAILDQRMGWKYIWSADASFL